MSRKGDFFFTYTGVQFWPLDPRPEEIFIEDIAHALAHTCRWGGQCSEFYSVAQHSVLVSCYVPAGLALAGLMHDAAEAYIGDVKRPLKRFLPEFQAIEHRLEIVICERFGISEEQIHNEKVKLADNRVLLAERRDLMHPDVHRVVWPIDIHKIEPTPGKIIAWSTSNAEATFIDRFLELKP